MDLPRAEYPRPQFARQDWLNLNGTWTFALDPGNSGAAQNWPQRHGFERPITVPFCPESRLSGVAHTDFIPALWYHRRFDVPAAWRGQRVLLRFGAVDYETTVSVDGALVGRHFGGMAGFAFDVTARVRPGEEHDLVVQVRDDLRSGAQPGGKQCPAYASHGCLYTRTTGIWQTVWLEPVPAAGLRDCRIIPDLDAGCFHLLPAFVTERRGRRFRATALVAGQRVAEAVVPAAAGAVCTLPLPNPLRPWSPAAPFLYDLVLEVLEGENVVDRVTAYGGLRKVHVEGNQFCLNNEPFYLRLVLDQGFYPEGIWTAPSDAALRGDIELSQRAGFNGARLHQKVFEERFHYWADRLGYLTWGEAPDWGFDHNRVDGARNYLSEWREVVCRDRNHPAIVAWSPFNETSHCTDVAQHHRLQLDAYALTHALDGTRPVNDASGYLHVETDLWTVHNYTQDPAQLQEELRVKPMTGVFRNLPDHEPGYGGQPYLVDEFGGIKWIPPDRQAFAPNSWGYGEGPRTLEEFYARLEGQVAALLALPHVGGFCYTQLTDVEQEQNGIYCYDRTPKFDLARVAAIFRRQRP